MEGKVPLTSWTPGITFSTPGDLSVTYGTRRGLCYRSGNLVILTLEIHTATFAHTTASGQLIITGVPFRCSASQYRFVGTLHQQGLNMPGGTHTQWNLVINSGGAELNICMSGNGAGEQLVQVAQVPSMVGQIYVGSIVYEAKRRKLSERRP